jgi:hypothetical protein
MDIKETGWEDADWINLTQKKGPMAGSREYNESLGFHERPEISLLTG